MIDDDDDDDDDNGDDNQEEKKEEGKAKHEDLSKNKYLFHKGRLIL